MSILATYFTQIQQVTNMKTTFTILCFLCVLSTQAQQLTLPPTGGNQKAFVGERIGLTDITIHYNRPGVKGREGKIWGQLVAYGFTDPGFGTSKAAPWRAGANENTTISFTDDVKVDGKDLAAGIYGLHVALWPDSAYIIFSKNSTAWGSFFYDAKEDALRLKVKPQKLDQSVEWLKYEFLDQTPNSATIALVWEKLKIPFKVEVDVKKYVLASMRRELQNSPGFSWQSLNQAAAYCLANNTNLDEGLAWAEASISSPFLGQANFTTFSTKAQILQKLSRSTEADETMKKALEVGNALELHQYARQLQAQKKNKEAFDIFKLNQQKHGEVWPINVGLARGYSMIGDYKTALIHAEKALAQATDDVNRNNLKRMIDKLKEGKDANIL